MFKPVYTVHTILLSNIVRIKNLITELNKQTFSDVVLARFEKESYALSTFASTSIEGNPLPLTDVRNILKHTPEHIRDTEREVLNYNNALLYLFSYQKKQKRIDVDFICHIQRMVVDGLLDTKNVGALRKEGVLVNNPKKRKVAYIPPDAKDVPVLVQELVEYVKHEQFTTDPLLLAGIFHKQFVIIHPFMDGNGRSARLLTKYLLAHMGLDTFQLFSFENYYNKNVTRYFESVGVHGDYYEIVATVDFTDWLVYFTDGIIDELLRVQKLLQETVSRQRVLEHEKALLQYIQKNGSITKKEYATVTKRARSTQILDLARLVERGVLIRNGRGKATYYTIAE